MEEVEKTAMALAAEKIAAGLRMLEAASGGASSETIYRDHVRPGLINEIMAEGYKTNDLVTLSGGLGGAKELRLNALVLELDAREFMLLFILGRAAKRRASGQVPGPHSMFVPVADILAEVERVRQTQPALQDLWRYPVAEDIRKAVFSLRAKIESGRGNVNILESGQRGVGYRLSTAPRNIEVPVLFPSISGGTGEAR
jgi:hypothetical protein